MEPELLWKIVAFMLGAISLPTLWLVVAHVKSHAPRESEVDGRLARAEGKLEAHKEAAETAARSLQHQIVECKAEDEKLEAAIMERRKAHDACQRDLVGTMGDLRVAIAELTASIRERPCQQQGYQCKSNPGNPGAPDTPGTCPERRGD